jgi:hypothetical protein
VVDHVVHVVHVEIELHRRGRGSPAFALAPELLEDFCLRRWDLPERGPPHAEPVVFERWGLLGNRHPYTTRSRHLRTPDSSTGAR